METLNKIILDYLKGQSFQVAAVFAVVLILTWLLRNRSAHVRYLLWLLVAIKCLTPPMMSFSIPVLPAETIPFVEQTQSSNIEYQLLPADQQPAQNTIIAVTPQELQFPINNQTANSENSLALHFVITPADIFLLIWVAGGAFYLLWATIKAIRLQLWLKKNHRIVSTELAGEVEELGRLWNPNKVFAVRLLEGISQPFVWGLWRGTIYLPGRIQSIQTEKQKAVVMHEMAHVIRLDAFVNLLQILTQSIFWFHPLVWIANRFIRQEREKCCDEAAIARLDTRPKEYGSAIIETLVQDYQNTMPIPSLAVAGPIKNIEDRIKTIMQPGRRFFHRPSVIALLIIGTLAAIIAPTTIALTQADTPPNHTVTGTVTDALTGAPIANAEVFDYGYNGGKARTTTNADGTFELKTWNEEHNISAYAEGYEIQHKGLLTFPFANNKDFNFQLKKSSAASADQGRMLSEQYKQKLEKQITIDLSKDKLTVPNAVARVSGAANVPFVWKDSMLLVGENFTRYIKPIKAEDQPASQILETLLASMGLEYELTEAGLRIRPGKTAETVINETPSFSATLPNGVTVNLLGVCEHPSEGKQWWAPNGTPLNRSFLLADGLVESRNGRPFVFVMEMNAPTDVSAIWDIKNSNETATKKILDSSGKTIDNLHAYKIQVDQGVESIPVRIGVATGLWKTIAQQSRQQLSDFSNSIEMNNRVITLSRTRDNARGTLAVPAGRIERYVDIDVHYTRNNSEEFRTVAIDLDGNTHVADGWSLSGGTTFNNYTYTFYNLQSKQIKEFQFQTRPYKWVTFENVSLKSGIKTDVKTSIQQPQTDTKQAQSAAAAKSTLEFRIAPRYSITERTQDGSYADKEKEYNLYVQDLQRNGPAAAKERNERYIWCKLKEGMPLNNVFSCKYENATYILLDNTPKNVMSAEQNWALKKVYEIPDEAGIGLEFDRNGTQCFSKFASNLYYDNLLAIVVNGKIAALTDMQVNPKNNFFLCRGGRNVFDSEKINNLVNILQKHIPAAGSQQPAEKQNAEPKLKKRYFFRLAADKDNVISCDNKKITFEEIETKLATLPQPGNTVLEVAFEPNVVPAEAAGSNIWQWLAGNPVWQKAGQFVQKYHLEYPSYVGVENPAARRGPLSIRTQELFAINEDIPLAMSVPPLETDHPLITIDNVHFAGGDPVLAAMVNITELPQPKRQWEVKMRLLDEKGKQLDSEVKYHWNSSIPAQGQTTGKNFVLFNFKKRDLSSIAQFEIEVRQLHPASKKPKEETPSAEQPNTSKLQQNDPSAVKILLKTQAVYKNLKFYSAQGEIISDIDSDTPHSFKHTFTIKLARPLYYIEWEQKVHADITSIGAVWSDGQKYYKLNAGQKEEMTSQKMSFAVAAGISGRASNTIPYLFYDYQLPSDYLTNIKQEREDVIDDNLCYVISGSITGNTTERYWISQKTFLIYQKQSISDKFPSPSTKLSDGDIKKMLTSVGQPATDEAIQELTERVESARTAISKSRICTTEIHRNIEVDQPIDFEPYLSKYKDMELKH